MFSEGREDVNNEERAGRPSTSTTDEKINEVEKMILANRRITVREVAEDLNISIGSCHSIFINELDMRRVAAKFVPKLLNCDQKQHRMNIANEMLDSVRDDPHLLQRVITGDEVWVYGYDLETKAQSSQWKLPHEPRPKKARQVRSNVKVLLTVFFDCRGMVHHEFLPQGRTVNKEYYLQVMRNLRKPIRQKRLDLRKNKNWLLHHDNAPAHTSLLVTACCCLFLAGKVEETPKKCKDIIKTARSQLNDSQFTQFGEDPKLVKIVGDVTRKMWWQEEVMTLEKILLQTIKFDLQVEHPYAHLLKYIKCLKGDKAKVHKILQMAWTFVNDSLCTTLSLQWEPEIIAIALMYLAGKLSKFEVTDWIGRTNKHNHWWDMFVIDLDTELLEDICHQVLDLYQLPPADNPQESPPPSPAPPPPQSNSTAPVPAVPPATLAAVAPPKV
ncbi:CCNK, partial [Cordylochernes scorpioides]